MAILFDIIILLVFLVTVVIGFRRGFVRTMVQLLGSLLAFFVAFSLSSGLSTFLYDKVVKDVLSEKVEVVWNDTVVDGAAQGINEQVQAVMAALPSPLKGMVDTEKIEQNIFDKDLSASSEAVAEYVADDLLRPIVVTGLRILSFILLFILTSLVIHLFEKLLRPILKIPVLRQVDGLFGGVLGLAKGVLFALIAVTVIQLLTMSGGVGPFTKENLENSVIVGELAEINPLTKLLNRN